MAKLHTKLFPVLVIVVCLIIIGTMFYSIFEGWNYLDSFYFTVMTLTTIGYGDFYPTSDISKMFTVFYVLAGVYLLFYMLTSFTKYYVEKKSPNIKRSITHTLEHMVHRGKKKKGDVVIEVPIEPEPIKKHK